MKGTVFLLEDDKSICELVRCALEMADIDTVCFNTVADFNAALNQHLPAVALLDIMLPGLDGYALLECLRPQGVPVIFITAKSAVKDRVQGLRLGADDYITKPYSPTILLLRIQNIFKRLDNSTEVLKYKDLEVSPSRGTLSGSNKELELTKNEMLIFQHLLNNQNRIVSRDELMTILWNNEEYINDNALTVNISRLRSKLEDFGYPNAIETRKGQGYILL